MVIACRYLWRPLRISQDWNSSGFRMRERYRGGTYEKCAVGELQRICQRSQNGAPVESIVVVVVVLPTCVVETKDVREG